MHGPRVAITLARFLPDGLVSVIRDGPGEAVVRALEQTTETPELVWTPAMATSLSAQVATMASDLYREQMKGRVVDWDVPEQASGQQDMRDEPQVFLCRCSFLFILWHAWLGEIQFTDSVLIFFVGFLTLPHVLIAKLDLPRNFHNH